VIHYIKTRLNSSNSLILILLMKLPFAFNLYSINISSQNNNNNSSITFNNHSKETTIIITANIGS